MKDQFVTYEIAKRLKELGFNEPCIAWYLHENNIILMEHIFAPIKNNPEYLNPKYSAVPLWQQAIDWLRVKHNINVAYHPEPSTNTFCAWWVCRHIGGKMRLVEAFDAYDKYEQAREAAITKALELISK